MEKIILTGVDGNLGGHAAAAILRLLPVKDLIFTAPNERALAPYALQGVETRLANFNNPRQLEKAFAGGDDLLLISMPFVGERRRKAHKNAIDAAVKAGVRKIFYTSIVGSGDAACESYEKTDHQYTEAQIFSSGLKYVILRHAQYAEAMISAFEDAAKTDGVLSNNMGDGRMAHVSRKDCAQAAACAVAGAAPDNRIYFITGPTANTMEEFVRIGSDVTGKRVVYRYIDDEAMYQFFDALGVPRQTDGHWGEKANAFPFCSRGMVTFGAAIRKNQMNHCTHDFETLTGKKPLTVRHMFEHIDEFRIGSRNATE